MEVCPCQPDMFIGKTRGFFRFLLVANEQAVEFLRYPASPSINARRPDDHSSQISIAIDEFIHT